ncbi:MAG TPA: farnesyl diphosphate synthase [Syntrophales bacterium]|nr:farnesyl diphosphate synthase [Syntrophales bacterium]
MSPTPDASLAVYLETRKKVIDEALLRYIPGEDNYPPVIFKAIRYSLFAGGKRIRPILCLASAEALGCDIELVLPVACALELIHTYSLVHDDLPAMDDDDYRRGRLTSHKVFGENMAILAGDGLLTEAFHLMSDRSFMEKIAPEKLISVIHDVAGAAGCFGMVGGQVVDVQSEGGAVDIEVLNFIHTRKTGAMIAAAVKTGAVLANAGEVELNALTSYGRNIGLAFQIADDILNVEGNQKLMGKSTGSDVKRGKVTYPALVGIDASRKKAGELVEGALSAIVNFDHRAEPLRMIAAYIIERKA